MSDRPLVVTVEHADRNTSARSAFIKSPIRVGRGELNDLVIDAPFVSTWHGLVQFDADGIRFVDLGSTNGTSLDGARLERNVPAAIAPGADLCIGPIRISLAWGAPEQRPEPVRPRTQFAMRAVAPGAAVARPVAGPDPVVPPRSSVAPGQPAASVAAAGGAPPPSREVEEAAQRAVEDASWQLGILHDAYRQARENLEGAASQAVVALPDAARRRARALMAERFPMGGEVAAAPAAAPVAGPPSRPGATSDPALPVVRAFAQSYVPGGVPLDRREDVEGFLGSLAELLEAAVKAYLELRRGYDEFGKEMGVRVPQGDGAVGRIRDPRQLLGYLLQPTAGAPRAQELASAFADLMIHQVALLNAVTAGAKDLLQRLSPDQITATLDEGGGGRLALGVKPLREGAQWRAFVQAYQALADDDHAFSDALFGKAFARAYAAVAGHRAPPPDAPDDPSTPRPG